MKVQFGKVLIIIVQIILLAIEERAKEWGVLISTGKTQVVLFNAFGINPTKLKKLILDGKELKYTNVATFLGMNFDSYLTWKDRFDTLRSVDATRT